MKCNVKILDKNRKLNLKNVLLYYIKNKFNLTQI